MIAALYVEPGGVYYDLPDVKPWGPPLDARLYAGPHPVVCHSPCARWGRYWYGGPSAKVRRTLGDDDGCFAAALAAVRRWGGVLEHPEASRAWAAFGLAAPPKSGGWIAADFEGGWTCCVEQGHYGHRARKATWLYVSGVEGDDLPSLLWGPSRAAARLEDGYHSAEERAARAHRPMPPEARKRARDAMEAAGGKFFERLSARERAATPVPFRDVLLSIARSACRESKAVTQADLFA